MKILHLISQDCGGAGRAAIRLHKALLEKNIDSVVLVQQKTTDEIGVIRLAKTTFQKIAEKLRPHLANVLLFPYKNREKDIFSPNAPSNKHLLKTIADIRPDIIHLHWINNGFLSIKDLSKINIPMLWSLHDANTYTGGCHVVPNGCEGFKTHCQKCPFLHSRFEYDLSYFTFNKKAKIYPKLNLTINALSRWIGDCAGQSTLLKDKKIINLPNCIDTNIYKPVQKSIAREILSLEQSPKIITFGAINPTSINRKGYPELKEALKHLQNKQNIKLIVFGTSQGEDIEGIQTLYLGHLDDDISLKIVYSLSDVVVVPSLCESFGQVALESLACGTPVVAFDYSGLKDIIEHKKNGYLAKPFEAQDFKDGIEWILKSQNYPELCQNARDKAIDFSSSKIATKYIQAYDEMIAFSGGGGYKEMLKALLFPSQKKFIAFGALTGTSIKRKGYNELKKALKSLQNPQDYTLLVFGSSQGESISNINTRFLGHISDDETLRLIYSACDVFITPSLAENLSNVIMESLACGTPVVGFDIGGNSDLIIHKQNGYLAKDYRDLREGIEWILNLPKPAYERLCHNARQKVCDDFESQKISATYIKTYKEILNA